MSYRHKETVEIYKKQEGFLGPYYTAKILAAIGRTKYWVQYENRFAADKTRLLIELVEETDIRPLPPTNFEVSDIVDAYVNDAWWVGKIVRKVDPNYYVRLDSTGNVVHCPFYKVRIHLEWEDGKWVYPGDRYVLIFFMSQVFCFASGFGIVFYGEFAWLVSCRFLGMTFDSRLLFGSFLVNLENNCLSSFIYAFLLSCPLLVMCLHCIYSLFLFDIMVIHCNGSSKFRLFVL